MIQTISSRRTDPARPASPATGAYKVDISRGERIGRVSSEWFSRPDDERYLSLGALHAAVRARAERATARTVETKALRVEATRPGVRSGSGNQPEPESSVSASVAISTFLRCSMRSAAR